MCPHRDAFGRCQLPSQAHAAWLHGEQEQCPAHCARSALQRRRLRVHARQVEHAQDSPMSHSPPESLAIGSAAVPIARGSRPVLTTRKLLIYAFPAFCLSIMLGPAGSLIQGIYTRDLGLKLADIANLILIARLLDAFTDPIIGYVSDATKSVMWGRKLWILAGAIVSIIGISWLYFPPQGVTPLYFF